MTVDEILNGRFEADVREALKILRPNCPKGYHPCIYANIKDGERGYLGVSYDSETSSQSIGQVWVKTPGGIVEAAFQAAKAALDPEVLQKRRAELLTKLNEINAQLASLPQSEPKPELVEA